MPRLTPHITPRTKLVLRSGALAAFLVILLLGGVTFLSAQGLSATQISLISVAVAAGFSSSIAFMRASCLANGETHEHRTQTTNPPSNQSSDEQIDEQTTPAEPHASTDESNDDEYPLENTFDLPDFQEKPANKSMATERIISAVMEDVIGIDEPLVALKALVGDIQTRRSEVDPDEMLYPSAQEIFLADALLDAGLMSKARHLSHLRLVRPRRAGLYYLRYEGQDLPYADQQTIIGIESALNRALLASWAAARVGVVAPTLEELYRLEESFESILIDQVADVDDVASVESASLPAEGQSGASEAYLREELATALECLRLPWRLTSDFRANSRDGLVAIRFRMTPTHLMPHTTFNELSETTCATTRAMRQRQALIYNLRVALVLAKVAFVVAGAKRVRIFGVSDNAKERHTLIYLNLLANKTNISGLWDAVCTPYVLAKMEGVTLALRDNRTLAPLEHVPAFETAELCPPARYVRPELSRMPLSEDAARKLGASTVAGLAIDEAAKRVVVAEEAGRVMDGSAEQAVRALLELSRERADAALSSAAKRTAQRLIAGTLSPSEPTDVMSDFVNGDALSISIDALTHGNVIKLSGPWSSTQVAHVLSEADKSHLYDNTPETQWHHFRNHVERVMFNLDTTSTPSTAACKLVPASYYEAHLLSAAALDHDGKYEEALVHAKRCLELDPYDPRANLTVVHLYEKLEDIDSAIEQLCLFLTRATTSDTVGSAYYRMAYFQRSKGNLRASEACYKRSLMFPNSVQAAAAMELSVLMSLELTTEEPLAPDEISQVLEEAGIPIAPTPHMIEVLRQGRQAALDEQLFGVASQFASTLANLTGDDVDFAIMHSIEAEPDTPLY